MKKDMETLQDVMARMDRLESGLSIQIDRFIKSEHNVSAAAKDFLLEVEELKAVKHALQEELPKTIHTSLEKNLKLMIPELLPDLIEGFQEETEDFIESSLEKAQKIKNELNGVVSEVHRLISSRKKEITLRGVGLSVIFCLSSLLTAGMIYYFFPQNITYGVSRDMAETIAFGEAVMENYSKLSPEQKSLFVNKTKDKLKRQ